MRSSSRGGWPSNTTSAPTCMCEASRSSLRKDASRALRRSLCRIPIPLATLPDRRACGYAPRMITMRRMRALAIGLVAVGVAALIAAVVVGESSGGERIEVGARPQPPVPDEPPCPGGRPPRPRVDRVDEDRAFSLLRQQVELGPRPAGSATSRRLGERLRRLLPNGRFEPVPARTGAERPLRNIVGAVRGRDPERLVVVGAHYDTKDLPGFVGANDGAGGTAAVAEIARSIRPRELGLSVVFILFDGEENPRGTSDAVFERAGLRGSRAAARRYPGAAAMVLLDLYGAPIYVRKEIVHNKHVVEQLRARGAVFVDEETEVPEGETVVFSAHGVSPAVHANAEARGLDTIDATCPLVTKVHVEAKKFAAEGYTIVLVGHSGHEEVEGTMGEVPGSIVLVESEDDVDRLEVEDPERVAYLTQTTLSVDETT